MQKLVSSFLRFNGYITLAGSDDKAMKLKNTPEKIPISLHLCNQEYLIC